MNFLRFFLPVSLGFIVVHGTDAYAQEVNINAPAAPVVSGVSSESRSEVDADGFVTDYEAQRGNMLGKSEKVASPHVIHKTPIFDNVPFFRLKKGDNLIKARYWWPEHKGVAPHFNDKEQYFLASEGKFYEIGNYSVVSKLNLHDLSYSLLFDWDLNLRNAMRLSRIHLNSSRFDYPLTPKQYQDLRVALRKNFASYLLPTAPPGVRPPRIEGANSNKHAVFENLAFDIYSNTVFHYRVLISPKLYVIKRKALIKGPRVVARYEFEDRSGTGNVINAPAYLPTDKATKAKALAAYRKSMEFRKIVASVLSVAQKKSIQMHSDD